MSDFETAPVGTMEELRKVKEERDALAAKLEMAERERNFLVGEYERAVGCGAQGFAHAAGHLFNAITNAKADINTERFLALREERDALAAHVERLEAVFHTGFESGDEHDLDAWEVEAKSVLAEPPTTSLTRLIAEKQAEALEEFRQKHTMPHMQNQWLKNAVAAYRSQAEGETE